MNEPSDLAGPPTRAREWAALVLPPVAWYVYEVGLAWALRASCTVVGAWLGPVWGGASLLACLFAAWLAWLSARPVDEGSPARPWVAHAALFTSFIFALAIAYQTIATLIVPSCAR